MKRFIYLILSCGLLFNLFSIQASAAAAARQNEYPIVLVHGLAGFGRDELLGIKYWGGFNDIQEDLEDYGYETYTATVGPFSSNWDRACELYSYIKGGTVDYGKAHAEKYDHERFGRTYPGLYPQWGEGDPTTGEVQKIHLIGHSMGGQTVRTMVYLLENSIQDEIVVTPAEELHPLFNDKKSWVHSVSTIATPHDGSTATYAVNGIVPCLQQMVAFFAAVNGTIEDPLLYDFKLDQWGLKQKSGESFKSYANRVWNSNIWTDTDDISAWDLNPNGAKELNSWVKAQPDVYYFSWGTEATYKGIFTDRQIPELGMNVFMVPFSLHIGAYTSNDPDQVNIESSWWKNDGLVSTNTMDGPQVGSNDSIVKYNGTPKIGKWNYMGVENSTDHMDIIGMGTLWNPCDWYRDLADVLGTLPSEN